jgi:hypothetical protein
MQNTSSALSEPILHGRFLSNHTSSLNAFWINPPTPWPYLLLNTLLSVVLSYNDFVASSRLWHLTHRQPMHVRLDTNELGYTLAETTPSKPTIFQKMKKLVTPTAFVEESNRDRGQIMGVTTRRDLRSQAHDTPPGQYSDPINDNIRSAFLNAYAAEGESFDPADDIKPDGGMGRIIMLRTIGGACWTALRVTALFALCLRISWGVSSDMYPDPASVIILLCSAQMYLGNRAMPRLFNVLMSICIYLAYTAFILIMFGPHSGSNYAGKAGVRGGECPYVSHWHCNSSSFQDWGCGAARSPWDTDNIGFPPNPLWLPDSRYNPDPNHIGINSNDIYMWTSSGFMKGVGSLYGAFAILFAVPLVLIGCCSRGRDLDKPLPALQAAALGKIFFVMIRFAFFFMILLSIVTFSVYIADEVHPPRLLYVDSFGPFVNGSSFAKSSQRSGNLTAVINGKVTFIGGNSTSWSDCFEVPISSPGNWGGIARWWDGLKEAALRVIALV